MSDKEVKETVVQYMVGDDFLYVSAAERKYANRIKKYKEKYPEFVTYHENADGSVWAKLPMSWFKFPTPKREISEAEKEQRRARMKEMWENK